MNEIPNHKDKIPQLYATIHSNNRSHAASHASFDTVQDGQKPEVIACICSDSRVDANLFGDTFNMVFMIENAGNRIDHPVLAANATYAAHRIPETKILYIVGHTGCGAIHGAIHNHDNEPEDLKNYLDDMWNYLVDVDALVAKTPIPDGVDPELFRNALFAEANVDYQVRKAMERYKPLIDAGKLVVVGGMYDLHGLYPRGNGRVNPINIEGIVDEKQIQNHPLFKILEEDGQKPFRYLHY